MIFNISGHENILGNHHSTLEFTKESELSKRGNCIIGIKADFSFSKLKEILEEYIKIKVRITCEDIRDEFFCVVNKNFHDLHEIVIRKTTFISPRTLGIRADKAAVDLNRTLIAKLKDPKARAKVEIIGVV